MPAGPASCSLRCLSPAFPDQREKERDQRLQEARSQATAGRAGHTTETTTTQSTQSADGSARSTVTKTERLVQSSTGWAGEAQGLLAQHSQCAGPSGGRAEAFLVLCCCSFSLPLLLLVLSLA